MTKTILIVEDQENILENLSEMLELWGYITITASNGQVAIDKLKNRRPDLILCDIDMPIMDGYEFLKWAKLSPDISRVPFVFLSASAQRRDIEKGKMSGVAAYLTKPISGDRIKAVIEEYVK